MTASVVKALGVQFGSARRLENRAEASYNQKGYFEHGTILQINKEILLRLGCKQGLLPRRANAVWTSAPPAFPENWQEGPQFADLRAQALALIETDFAGHEIWGWKDPRTVFTLAFWQDILPPMHYVICLRSPVDTAQSLVRFLDCTFERGLYLWALYLYFAFKNTSGMERMVVHTESWIDAWPEEVERLCRFLGRPELADRSQLHEAVRNVVDENLWHHRSAAGRCLAAEELYERVRRSADGATGDCHREFLELLEDIAASADQADEAKSVRDGAHWSEQARFAIQEILEHTPPGSRVILVDDACLGPMALQGRVVVPFMERDGQYWGSPANDEEAVTEFRRLAKSGADFIAVVWNSFWWLKYYPALFTYIKSKNQCVVRTERVVLYDLQG